MRNHDATSSRRTIRRFVVPGVLLLACVSVALATSPAVVVAEEKAKEKIVAFEQLTSAKKEARIELGRRLFFEPFASPSGKRSCASCHEPDHGFSDPKRVSVDDFGNTRRHSQAILDTAHNPSAHWDGEFKDVADLVSARLSTTPFSGSYGGRGGGFHLTPPQVELEPPPAPGTEKETKEEDKATGLASAAVKMLRELFESLKKPGREVTFVSGFHNGAFGMGAKQVPAQLLKSGRYLEGFRAAFGTPDVTLDRIGSSLDAFCKTIESTEAPYDRYRAGDTSAISDSAKRGLELFEGKAGCAQCHLTTDHKGAGKPLFTDYAFHNTGVSLEHAKANKKLDKDGAQILALLNTIKKHKKELAERKKTKGGIAELTADHGHMGVSADAKHLRAFKTPTLRDVAKRGPYMHTGTFKTLEDVVRYYAKGGGADPIKDKRLTSFAVTDQEVADLVAFLKTLSGDARPGLAKKAWSKRGRETRLRFIDHRARPMADLAVRVKPAGDVVPGDATAPATLRTDKHGWLRFEPGATTHTELQLPEGVVPVGGTLVPDTCREVAVQVPVKGRMKLTLVFSKDQEVPRQIVAHHGNLARISLRARSFRTKLGGKDADLRGDVFFFDKLGGSAAPVTVFVRTGVVKVKGQQVARYEGWVRSDVPAHVVLEIPGIHDGKKKHKPSLVLAPDQEMRLDLTSF